ncbi:MAG: hypothetical protein EZS28_021810 [Streblomastix strix]|uniref:Uncharacterized protein n=1 Tax=Streblomastix strix TaxID=222440 RepID=A0A5J4VJJ5_9EUKA|nr:MAG: hypothetical protein EZS28_021810 [Streblomastix strix]
MVTQNNALLLLKTDKTELIDAYSKTEDDELLALKLNISDQIDAYTKQEDDALLLLKADKTQLIDAYNKTEADALLDDKLYIITANKTFNNSCRFVSFIDGMSSITGSSFIKSGSDKDAALLCAGVTKPTSELGSGSVDDSNFVKKTGYATQTIEGNLIRSGSEDSFVNIQPFRYIISEAANHFVQVELLLTQYIEGKLIRPESSDSFDNLQPRQQATKYGIKGSFNKKERQKSIIIFWIFTKGWRLC